MSGTVGRVYEPKAFVEGRPEVVLELVRSAGYGHLVVNGPDGRPTSTPMPFLVDDELSAVRAHLARPNPVWKLAPTAALLIVPVTDAYVSPSWYPSKREHGRVVPTWNYEVVHLHGELVAHDHPAWTEQMVRDLTDTHEASLVEPWSVDDAPADHVAGMLRAIVGVELLVERVVAKRKLSQNRSEADHDGARRGLSRLGDPRSAAVAAAMDGD